MKDSRDLSQIENLNSNDYLASLVKSIAGSVPFAGTFLTEVIGSIIPKQRVDRIADFAILLSNRIAHLEESEVKEKIRQESIGELVEEATRQAAKSTSTNRRQYLANLVSFSISSEEQKTIDERHLLRTLGELNDKEIIWLRSYAVPWSHEDAFRDTHQEVLDTPYVTFDASEETRNTATLNESYNSHLISLGLLRQDISDDGDGQPEFDRHKGQFRMKDPEITYLGEMLLSLIGLHPDDQDAV
jgi:hypothetical protein